MKTFILVFCTRINGLYKTAAEAGRFDELSRHTVVITTLRYMCLYLSGLQRENTFLQLQKCGTCTQLKLFNITHKFVYAYSAVILKREVCDQTMSSCCKHNLLRRTRRSYQTCHACSPRGRQAGWQSTVSATKECRLLVKL